MAMNIYLVSQNENSDYDTYDSFVCYASSEEEARNMLPDEYIEWGEYGSSWCSHPDHALAEFIGVNKDSDKQEVILASFNAG